MRRDYYRRTDDDEYLLHRINLFQSKLTTYIPSSIFGS